MREMLTTLFPLAGNNPEPEQPEPAIMSMETYNQTLREHHLAPLWEALAGLVPDRPEPTAIAHHWDFNHLRQALLEAGSLISVEQAERRVLVLENPALPAGSSRITDTLYAGVQIVLPGEVAPPHRHTPAALRFILEASGGHTSVNGERTTMHPGDFVITPSWAWHSHGNLSQDPVIWLDGLDAPLMHFLKAGFRESYPAGENYVVTRPEGDSLARYGMGLVPITPVHHSPSSPIFSYPYERTRQALEDLSRHDEIDPHHGICLRYVNPLNGDWAIPTIGAEMRLLPAGFRTRPYRSNASAVFVCVEGELEIRMADESTHLLKAKDICAIPAWVEYRLSGGSSSAVAFSFSDRPVLEKLGVWREALG